VRAALASSYSSGLLPIGHPADRPAPSSEGGRAPPYVPTQPLFTFLGGARSCLEALDRKEDRRPDMSQEDMVSALRHVRSNTPTVGRFAKALDRPFRELLAEGALPAFEPEYQAVHARRFGPGPGGYVPKSELKLRQEKYVLRFDTRSTDPDSWLLRTDETPAPDAKFPEWPLQRSWRTETASGCLFTLAGSEPRDKGLVRSGYYPTGSARRIEAPLPRPRTAPTAREKGNPGAFPGARSGSIPAAGSASIERPRSAARRSIPS